MTLWRSKLARALVEYETLDLEEVKKVIKGEAIRSISEVLGGDKTEMERASDVDEESAVPASSGPLARMGQQQTAKQARGV